MVSKDLVFFKKSLDKTNALLITSILLYLPKDERNEELVEKFKKLIKKTDFHSNSPSYRASNNAWEIFYQQIRKETEDFLGLDLERVESMNYERVYDYLEINQFFLDCLQVAIVDDREAVEDMILNIPEEWEAPTE